MFLATVLLCSLLPQGSTAGRLAVNGSYFVKDGHRVFLSGVNQAWVHYGYDFGNDHFRSVRSQFEQVLTELEAAGGNSIRVWVHIGGQSSPQFDERGFVNGTDGQGTLTSDLQQYLQDARRHGILVFLTLWSGAALAKTHYRLDGLLKDHSKLQSYIDHALTPLVRTLSREPALGGWDLMNEPEGILTSGLISSDPCQDTSKLKGTGVGWAGQTYTPYEIQRFLNVQADAIRAADPGALVTVGCANNYACTDQFGFTNLLKDSCLVAAGGKPNGVLSFYQYHTYARKGHWDGHSPMQRHYYEYGVDKPIVIGEFRESNGAGMTIKQMFNHAYFFGYSGAWSWMAKDDNWGNERLGIAWLRDRHNETKGGLVHIGGQTSPKFDDRGFVNGTDRQGTLTSDLQQYLQDAQRHGILVFLTLWSGAALAKTHYRLDGLLKDRSKLQSYIDHALVPLVRNLSREPALGGWDLMNEPEGILTPGLISSDPCQDTSKLRSTGAGWAGQTYTPFEIQSYTAYHYALQHKQHQSYRELRRSRCL